MSLISLAIYGSHARGDYVSNSDVDLFGLATSMPSRLVTVGNIKLNIYDYSLFSEMAQNGSLYVWHLKEEGKIIFDFESKLKDIFFAFKLKKDYSIERIDAAQIGWLLFSPETFCIHNKLRVDTIIYVLRTIVYSFLAERNIPAFSLREAIKHYKEEDVARLWMLKSSNIVSNDDLVCFQGFLNRTTGVPPSWMGRQLEDIIDYFDKSSFAYRRCKELMASNQYNLPPSMGTFS